MRIGRGRGAAQVRQEFVLGVLAYSCSSAPFAFDAGMIELLQQSRIDRNFKYLSELSDGNPAIT